MASALPTQAAKVEFVRKLTNQIRDKIIGDINSNSVPPEWEGLELRQWIADAFQDACLSRTHTQERIRKMKFRRASLNLT